MQLFCGPPWIGSAGLYYITVANSQYGDVAMYKYFLLRTAYGSPLVMYWCLTTHFHQEDAENRQYNRLISQRQTNCIYLFTCFRNGATGVKAIGCVNDARVFQKVLEAVSSLSTLLYFRNFDNKVIWRHQIVVIEVKNSDFEKDVDY